MAEEAELSPEEKLLKTKNSQIASLVVDLAYLAALEELEERGKEFDFKSRGQQPDYLAGHSAGEHAAFVLAGSISFQQALDIMARVRVPAGDWEVAGMVTAVEAAMAKAAGSEVA